MDEASIILDSQALDTVSRDDNTELDRVKSFSCGCQLNAGQPCCTGFQPADIVATRLDIQELTESKGWKFDNRF